MAFPRISGRRGQPIDLDTTFYRGGVPTDPFAIRKVEIYQTTVAPHHLVAAFPFVDPDEANYPAPATRQGPGQYTLIWHVPAEISVPDVFIDVWAYFPDNPCEAGSGGTFDFGGTGTDGHCDLNAPELQSQLISCCHRFWLYPDSWFCDDGLQCIKFGFEPLDQKFNTPERRCLEVGIQPLPLYEYNANLVNCLIPFLRATIRIETRNCELLVDDEAMEIGLRSGNFRSNPFVFKYLLDTTRFLIGTYRYRITVYMPDGTTRVSPWFILQVV